MSITPHTTRSPVLIPIHAHTCTFINGSSTFEMCIVQSGKILQYYVMNMQAVHVHVCIHVQAQVQMRPMTRVLSAFPPPLHNIVEYYSILSGQFYIRAITLTLVAAWLNLDCGEVIGILIKLSIVYICIHLLTVIL